MNWGDCEDCLYYKLGTCEDGEIGSGGSCYEPYYEEDEDEEFDEAFDEDWEEEFDNYEDDRLPCGCCSCCDAFVMYMKIKIMKKNINLKEQLF